MIPTVQEQKAMTDEMNRRIKELHPGDCKPVDLFDIPTKHLHRTNDSVTSKTAAKRARRRASEELRYIRAAIELIGRDFTARELSEHSGLDYILVQKRLSVLQERGYISKSDPDDPNQIKRHGQMVWRKTA